MDSYLANEARNIPSSSCHGMVQEIHVLLVDHDSDSLMNTTKMLEMCSYRVKIAELASGAISALSSGKIKFDIVVADVNSPDFRAFELLYHAKSLDLPVIFMSAEDNTYLAMRALENGAFMFFKKPATMDILRCLWQHVFREKIRNGGKMEADKRGRRSGMSDMNPDHTLGGEGKGKEKSEGQKGDADQPYHRDVYNLVTSDGSNKGVKRKVCIEWTDELHAKFLDAMAQLGEGRCFPKEILGLMNVPGLKRMQVASHLQKCRNNNRQAREERRLPPSQTFHDLNRPRKFGSMPQLGRTLAVPRSTQVSGTQPENEIHNTFGNVHASGTKRASTRSEPGPSNTARSNNLQSHNDFFLLEDPARPIRNFSSIVHEGSKEPKQISGSVPSPCQRDQAYDHDQNSTVARVDSSNKGKRSSETLDAESDGSEAKANIKSECE